MDSNHQLDQQQQAQSQSHSAPNQLPDESYIEKLFPKCQPKTAQTRGANQQFRHRRTMRAAERQHQQQHKRQNHAKQQQQQQQGQQHHQQQPFRHESGPRRTGTNTDEPLARGRSSNSVSNIESGQSRPAESSRRDYNSSDSSDKEANANGRSRLASVRRSNSSHLAPAANGQQPGPSPSVSSQQNASKRTKKYRASKNLQQQLKRSQSSGSKLFGVQPLSMDQGDEGGFVLEEKRQRNSPLVYPNDQTESAGPGSERNHTDGAQNGQKHAKESLGGRRSERGNRTNRGIVFAEPIATTNIELDSMPRPTSNDSNSPSQSTKSNEHETKIAALGPAPSSVKTRQQHAQQRQVSSSVGKTADALQSKAGAGGDAPPVKLDETVTEIHPVEQYSNTEQLPPQSPADQRKSVADLGGDVCETGAKVDNADNDNRFINLFVYDNTSPKKHEDRLSDKAPLITFKQDSTTNCSEANNNIRQRELKSGPRHLPAIDPDEEGLISNDASIEELCSFGDNDAELGIKIKPDSCPSKKAPDYDRPQAAEKVSDVVLASISKSILKHHRSLTTLQTVDEKAEINIEEEDNCNNDNPNDLTSPTLPKTPQVELSETMMIKKGLVPPGFPQRVRPNPVEASPKEVPHLPQATSPTNVPEIVPVSTVNTASDGREQKAVEQERKPVDRVEEAPCIQLDNASMRNLSEALTKVHLDTSVTLRQLKLPNEASHFSAIRTTLNTLGQSAAKDTQHHASIQFNTLSDAESGADDESIANQRHSVNSVKAHPIQKRDYAGSITRYASPSSSSRLDDESAPATRTALVFPRLDEGLSSEAESCDDEMDDDDDKAMEADVDADDDEDEDEDEDDDDADGNQSLDKDTNPMQANVDSFQHHPMKPQNRRIGNIQQLQPAPGSAQARLPDLNQVKFNDFTNQESLDQDDLKPNYANQNGQSNYWLGGSSQQTGAMSSQPVPFSRMQHGSNNNSSNNVNLSRSNSYANREDVKTANRLSSDTDNETDRLLGSQRNDQLQKMVGGELGIGNNSNEQQTANSFAAKQGTNSREVLIEGVLFNVKYLGSTHTECEGRGEKEDRIHQAELAVHEVKFRNGETHSPVEVQLFISTEKIMVLDDKHRKIMMDHSLRTISYIADIGDAIVLIVRKKSTSIDNNNELSRPISKTSCHVFESNESHTITKSISQAFQVAYTELLKANGAADGGNYLPKELDYQEVLNSQEMSTTELEMFARKENQREVIVPKRRGEILGLSIVESGWGSVLPTAVIASLKQDGPAYRCKKLSVGDQILSINGISLVGLSLAECQKILRKTKGQSVARLSVVPCPITVEVKIKRPDTKYQLGFSVQHGVICSLLRGGIAERGGVRVGHRIISINGTTVVGVPHDKIVTLLASSVGEIRMKTCLTSLYRHMLGEEKNVSFV